MALCSNTYRRGGVYWWRARFADARCVSRTVAFSLQVHDPRRARQLGVRLTAEADRLRRQLEAGAMDMEELGQALIIVREAGRAEPLVFTVDDSVMAQLDAEERRRRTPPLTGLGLDLDHDPAPDRIAQLAAAIAEEDRSTLPDVSARARWQVQFDDNGYLLGIDDQPDPTPVMAFVYHAIAYRGAKARLTAEDEAVLTREGRSRADIEAIRHLLLDVSASEMRTSWRLGPTREAISARLLANGIAPAFEIVHAVRRQVLLTRAGTLAALAHQPRFALSSAVPRPQEIATSSDDVVTSSPTHAPAPLVDQPGAEPARPPLETAVPATLRESVSLFTLVEALIVKKHARMGDHTRRQYRSIAKLFAKVAATNDVQLMGQQHIGAYFDLLARLPKSYGKSPHDEARSLEEIVARGEQAAARSGRPRSELIGLDPPTIDRHVTQLRAILKYARSHGHTIGDLSTLDDMREPDPQRDEDKRRAFSHENEVTLFSSPPWTGCSADDRLKPGPVLIHDALYWAPLLAKYELLSRSEAVGIMLDDIDVDAQIPTVWIHENELRRHLKTPCRTRSQPIHPELQRLGFLEYVHRLRLIGVRTLFPDLLMRGQATPMGDLFDKLFAPALDAALPQARGNRQTLHSFRKGGNTHLASQATNVALEVRLQLMGHTPQSVNGRHYVAQFPADVKLAALQRLQISTAHLRPAPIRLLPGIEELRLQKSVGCAII